MTKVPMEVVDNWCMAEWKVQHLREAGGFECKTWFWNGPAIQSISFTSPEGEIPRKLLDNFICECCEQWCVDFSHHLPTKVDFDDHDEIACEAHDVEDDEDECIDCDCDECLMDEEDDDTEYGDTCHEYFAAWGTHSEGNLIEAEWVDGNLTVVFWTTGFPADHWAQALAEAFPELDVDYYFRTFSGHTGSFKSRKGEILEEVHVVAEPIATVSW